MKKKLRDGKQFGALPWRTTEDGRRQIMLLTSRETGRWVIPKGWPIKGRKPAEVALQEAYEEAGLIGRIVGKRAVGSYRYGKRLANVVVPCKVRVFLFQVERQVDDWPEKEQRETQWFDAHKAAKLVREGGLTEIIDRTCASVRREDPTNRQAS